MTRAIEIADSLDAATALLPEWRALWLASKAATPFQSPHWLLAWWEAFAPGDLRMIAVRQGGRLVGLAPLYREEGQYGPRLLPLGISLSDYVDVLVDDADMEAAGAAIASAFADLEDIDSVEWGELQPHADALRLAAPFGWETFTQAGSTCPVATLPPELAQLPHLLSPSRRRHLTTARNRARRRGEVNIIGADADKAPVLLSEVVRLHTAAWQARGEPGVFSDRRVAEFHRAALPALMREGIVRLYALTVASAVAAVYYGFQHRNRAYAYLSGYDPEFAFESPGALLLAHAMEQAIQEGAEEFHFLRGREAYKYEWGGKDRVNVRLTFVRRAERRACG
ncbi:MAG TPA: GNAT family N-acetyltransferase [Rhizomicrobium sp.]|nr:GNAT family N-acetyltransferase [Rhizomicrobium sp.]